MKVKLDNLKSPTHPMWPLLRLMVLMVSMSFVLWLFSSNFDQTELQSIIMIFIAAASTEGAIRFLNNKK